MDVSPMDDPMLLWDRDFSEQLVALDLDVPRDGTPLSKSLDLHRFLGRSSVRPHWAWVTKSGGLRLVFVDADGVSAIEAALLWRVLSRPDSILGYRVETKTDTRHPGARPEDESLRCGPVHRLDQSVRLDRAGTIRNRIATGSEWQDELDRRGIEHGRYAAAACPMAECPDRRKTSGNDCVVVSDSGIHCFRCGRHEPPSSPNEGINSFRPDRLVVAARSFVSAEHAIATIVARHPDLTPQEASDAWTALVRIASKERGSVDSDTEQRVLRSTTLGEFPFIRSENGTWLQPHDLVDIRPSRSTYKFASFVRTQAEIDIAMGSGSVPGFEPLSVMSDDAVVSPLVEIDDMPLRLATKRGTGLPRFRPGARPSDEEFAVAAETLDRNVHGFDSNVAAAIVLAVFEAQTASGPPPIIVITGPTGAGKTATTQAAASLVRGKAVMFTLSMNAKDLRRSIGNALVERASILHADEVGRAQLDESFGVLLELNHELRFDRKGSNEQTVKVTAPVVLSGSIVPKDFLSSPELSRRSVAFEISGREGRTVPPLEIATHAATRDAAETFVRRIWHVTRALPSNRHWRDVAMRTFGASTLAELSDAAGGEDLLRSIVELYEHYRKSADSKPWIDTATDEEARRLLARIGLDSRSRTSLSRITNELNAGTVDRALGLDPRESVKLLATEKNTEHVRIKFERRSGMRGAAPQPSTWPAAIMTSAHSGSRSTSPISAFSEATMSSWKSIIEGERSFDVLHSITNGRDRMTALVTTSGVGYVWTNDEIPSAVRRDASERPFRFATFDLGHHHGAIATLGSFELDLRAGAMRIGLFALEDGQLSVEWPADDPAESIRGARRAVDSATNRRDRTSAARTLVVRSVEAFVRLAVHVEESLGAAGLNEFAVDRSINRRGIRVDMELAEGLRWMLHEVPDRLQPAISEPGGLARLQHEITTRLGIDVSNQSTWIDTANNGQHTDLDWNDLNALLLAVSPAQRWTRGVLEAAATDGRLRETLRSYGAVTGRWSSRAHRTHNLPKAGPCELREWLVDQNLDDLVAFARVCRLTLVELVQLSMRRVFVPAVECDFVQADFRQIEPRIIAWLAGDESTLEFVRGGGDIYLAFASNIFGPSIDADDLGSREAAKRVFVPLCYLAGDSRLQALLQDAAASAGLILDARAVRGRFNDAYELETAFRNALWSSFVELADSPGGEESRFLGHVILERDVAHRGVRIILPSGRSLVYGNVARTSSGYDANFFGRQRHLHPGALLENVAQAVGADVLRNALTRLEDNNVEVVLHIHDEIVAEVAETTPNEVVEEIMTTSPTWAEDLPLAVSIKRGKSFS